MTFIRSLNGIELQITFCFFGWTQKNGREILPVVPELPTESIAVRFKPEFYQNSVKRHRVKYLTN